MSCHQSVTIGPFLRYDADKRVDHYDLLPDERLSKAFPMGASHADVYLANIMVPGVESIRINNEDPDMLLVLTASHAEQVKAFRTAFAREIEVLDKAYGTKGVVRFGVVVSWG